MAAELRENSPTVCEGCGWDITNAAWPEEDEFSQCMSCGDSKWLCSECLHAHQNGGLDEDDACLVAPTSDSDEED
jgi:hypothetical protein